MNASACANAHACLCVCVVFPFPFACIAVPVTDLSSIEGRQADVPGTDPTQE